MDLCDVVMSLAVEVSDLSCSVNSIAVSFVSFHFYIFWKGYPSAKLVFKGPPLKRKRIHIQGKIQHG